MASQFYDEIITLNDSSHRHKDENGHLIIKDNPIALVGVLPFLRNQIESTTSTEVVYVYRSEESLKEAYHMFKDKPIVYNHEWVGKDGDRNNADGHIGSHVYYKDGGVYGDLIIYNSNLIDKIESGACTQLSAGYSAVVKPGLGKYQDQDYNYSIFYTSVNHLAVVEQGRAGAQLSIKDQGLLMGFSNVLKNDGMDQGTDFTAVASPCEVAEDEMGEEKKEERTEEEDTEEEEDEDTENDEDTEENESRKEDCRRLIHNACKERVKRGEMSQEDMDYVMDHFKIPHMTSRIDKQIRYLRSSIAHHNKLEKINKAVDEIRSFEVTKDFKKLDNSDVDTQYARAYNYVTKEQLPKGMDARTAFLTYVTNLQKQRELDSRQRALDSAPLADNGVAKCMMDAYNSLIHKQKEVNSLIRRRAF